MVANNDKKLRLLLKDCANGFYQQMYFLGKDVIHPKGNHLTTYGFKKSPSTGLKGTSCYTGEFNGGVIELYGSCAAYYSDSSNMVFLRKRCRFYQWLSDHKLVAGQWTPDDLKIKTPDSTLSSLIPLLQWWTAYEEWIIENLGIEYRDQCFTEWSKIKGQTPWLRPTEAKEWVQQFIEERASHVRPKHFLKK